MAWLKCTHAVTQEEKQFPIRKVLTSIGREKGNDLVLSDPTLGATHASLVRSGATWSIALNQRGGEIRVNGRRVRHGAIEFGDDVAMGAWRLALCEGEPPEHAEPMDAEKILELVELSGSIMAETTSDGMFNALLNGLVRLTGAEKGFIIALGDDRRIAASHNLSGEALTQAGFSDSIVDTVIATRDALIISDAVHDSRFGSSRSVIDLRLSSVMCAPLVFRDELIGVVYLGNDAVTGLFTTNDLHLLKIYAAQAALVLHQSSLVSTLRDDNSRLREQLVVDGGQILGDSEPMQRVFRVLQRVAPTDIGVLILGETGTGKELVANELHRLSERAEKPFMAINCGAIPENLLESELFGHRKGSFTGAVSDKMGRIEAADGGTLFLDEIGEMPMNLQVKLLRVLQERVISRVGDLEPRPIDIRVIAATNRDPMAMIDEGRFREDLFYRLNEIALKLPPLRERGGDILLLAQYFLTKYRDRYGSVVKGFDKPAERALRSAAWPGNVRELESRVKKAVIMAEGARVTVEDLGLDGAAQATVQPLAEAQEAFKVEYIRKVLDMTGWNKAATARALDVDARTIFRYIEKLKAAE